MEKITYILGAGFSAPLGLPVTSNFLIKSKDLFFSNPTDYKYFLQVFDTIEKLSISKNYFNTNLNNIEEILSILEMERFLERKKLKPSFIKYIQTVITYYTPKLADQELISGSWHSSIFSKGDKTSTLYAYFIASLLGGMIRKTDITDSGNRFIRTELDYLPPSSVDAKYNIISLNYDLVIEEITQFFSSNLRNGEPFKIIREPKEYSSGSIFLAKLHGSVDSDVIVPPTWAKGLDKQIAQVWSVAKKIIEESNQIRFIGYSLPKTDTYIQYLFKAAIIKSKHLKNIDVICLDPDGSVRKRFDELITFDFYRFANKDVLSYFSGDERKTMINASHVGVSMNNLESVHHAFMEKYA